MNRPSVRTVLAWAGLVAAVLSMGAGRHRPVAGALPSARTEIGRVAGRCHARPLYCGAIGYVDCGAAVDGPAFYFSRSDGRIIGRCGGYCMGERDGHCRRECPPPSWTCGP